MNKKNVVFKSYFLFQKKLRTTDKYNFNTCITECSVDAILQKCRCLPFFYPEVSE